MNDGPTVAPDTNSTAEDTTLTVNAASGVLANDSDIDGDSLSVTQFTVGGSTVAAGSTLNLAEGDLTINADGSYTFVPAANFNGSVPQATYIVSDGTTTTTSTLDITVTPVNDGPTVAPDTNTTAEDTTLTVNAASGVLANDSDIDGDSLSLTQFTVGGSTVAAGSTLNLAEGDLTINADGSYTFVPTANFNGAVPQATYTVSDGTTTTTSTLDITVTPVNDGPTVALDANSTAEDTTLTVNAASGVLANDSDIDGDSLSVTQFTVGGSTVAAGSTLSLAEGDLTINADGSYTFVPAANFNGAVPQATYTVSDGTTTTTSTLDITVTPVNDGPTVAPDTNSTAEDTTLTVNAASGVLANDSDVDGDSLSVTQFMVGGSTVAAGSTLSLAEGDLTINADGSYTFAPTAHFNGVVPQVTYAVSDGIITTTSTLNITVTPVNDAPIASPDTNTTAEDTTLTVNAASGVLANDSDIDGDSLSVTQFMVGGTTVAAGSTLILAEGDLTINADGSYTFVPTANFNGAVPQATYVVSDGTITTTSTLNITVTPVNDAPIASPDTNTTDQDTTLTVNAASGVLANDSDIDGDSLSVTQFMVGGTTVAAGSTMILAEGDLTINADGSYTFVPTTSFNGTVPQVTYAVSDGTVTTTSTLDITVTPPNVAPTTTSDASTGNTLSVPVTIDVLSNDFDIDGTIDPTTVQIVGTTNPGDNLIVAGEGVWSVDPITGDITFTPEPNFLSDPTPISYTVADNTGAVSNPAAVTIDYDSSAPLVSNDVSEGNVPGDVVTLNVLANDSITSGPIDPASVQLVGTSAPGESLTVSGEGTWSVNSVTGAVTFTPDAGFQGDPTPVSYTVANVFGQRSASATLSVLYNADIVVFEDLLPDQPSVLDNLQQPQTEETRSAREPVNSNNDIGVDPIVVETVRSVSGQENNITDVSAQGIVLQTVNEIDPLNGFTHPTINRDVTVARVHEVPELNRLLDNAEQVFGFRSAAHGVESLTGFSLRVDVVDDAGAGGQETGQIVVDTLVREQVLYVEISNSIDEATYGDLKRYQVLQADGRPLPDWIRQADNGLLLAEVPASTPTISLLIVAEFSDGATVEHSVVIQTSSGEIQPAVDGLAEFIPTFSEQLHDSVNKDLDELKMLDKTLNIFTIEDDEDQ